jgi:hypothetical protein
MAKEAPRGGRGSALWGVVVVDGQPFRLSEVFRTLAVVFNPLAIANSKLCFVASFVKKGGER